MSYTNGLDKPTDYFNTKLYTGNGSTQSITGVGFQPDWVWIKERSSTSSHALFDAIRGATIKLSSNNTDADNTSTADLTSFDSDGFTNGDSGAVNESGQTYASWNWLASNTTASNTDGSITSTVSANTTSGFRIVSYTGNGTAGATVGHGLGVVPKMIIVKKLSGVSTWNVYHQAIGNGKGLYLNTTDAQTTYTGFWNDTSPTSSVFTVGADNTTNSATYIAYCFAEKTGYSKFGSYTGNGSTDGTFVYTGFKPAWIMIKRTDSTSNWLLYDNKREGYNQANDYLNPDNSNVEGGGDNYLDLLSNGFKTRVASQSINVSGETYIYMVLGQSLVGSNNVPCTAR